jgi:hypothetical protein
MSVTAFNLNRRLTAKRETALAQPVPPAPEKPKPVETFPDTQEVPKGRGRKPKTGIGEHAPE